MDRSLSHAEEQLVRWMLEHGEPSARTFLTQLEKAKATEWRCPCGCASVNFSIDGLPEPSGQFQIVADFIFGVANDLSGAFVFEKGGILAGLEIYGLGGDAPKTLPLPESLRPFPEIK